jgi:hypothetical protein
MTIITHLCVDDYAFRGEVAVDEFGRLVEELKPFRHLRESFLDLNLVKLKLVRPASPA